MGVIQSQTTYFPSPSDLHLWLRLVRYHVGSHPPRENPSYGPGFSALLVAKGPFNMNLLSSPLLERFVYLLNVDLSWQAG